MQKVVKLNCAQSWDIKLWNIEQLNVYLRNCDEIIGIIQIHCAFSENYILLCNYGNFHKKLNCGNIEIFDYYI